MLLSGPVPIGHVLATARRTEVRSSYAAIFEDNPGESTGSHGLGVRVDQGVDREAR
jgi:hypothetical protein